MDAFLERKRRDHLSGASPDEAYLAHLECRRGNHVPREDQIILYEDRHRLHSNRDVGGCQCGDLLLTGYELCKAGFHRLEHNPWSVDLSYWCIREEPNVQIGSPEFVLRERNPHTHSLYSCQFRLSGNEACSKGLHFFELTIEGRICRNPECKVREKVVCEKHDLVMEWGNEEEVRGIRSARCTECLKSWRDSAICEVGDHLRDPAHGGCIRSGCMEAIAGMGLYEALSMASRKFGQPLAIARYDGRTLATAGGWDEKLKQLGVKRPPVDPEKRTSIWGRRRDSVWVRQVYPYRRFEPIYFHPQTDYRDVRADIKAQWANRWYPLRPDLNLREKNFGLPEGTWVNLSE